MSKQCFIVIGTVWILLSGSAKTFRSIWYTLFDWSMRTKDLCYVQWSPSNTSNDKSESWNIFWRFCLFTNLNIKFHIRLNLVIPYYRFSMFRFVFLKLIRCFFPFKVVQVYAYHTIFVQNICLKELSRRHFLYKVNNRNTITIKKSAQS